MLLLNGKMLFMIKKYLTFFLFPLLIYETGNLENHSGSTRQNLSSLPTETIAVTDTFIHPETYDSKISDTSNSASYAFKQAIENAKGKTILLESTYSLDSLIEADAGGYPVHITSNANAKIVLNNLKASDYIWKYFTMNSGWNYKQDYPDSGDVYSINGSSYEIVPNIGSRSILAKRISGSTDTPKSGTLKKISGKGKDSYTYNGTGNGLLYIPIGNFTIKNASSVLIENVDFVGRSNRESLTFLSNLLIKDCKKITLKNVKSRNSGYNGLYLIRTPEINVENCASTYNGRAGIEAYNIHSKTTIAGGNYSNNGVSYLPRSNGYGVTISHEWGHPQLDNQNVLIQNVTADSNKYIGIQVWAKNFLITKNKINGFGVHGISSINQAGETPDFAKLSVNQKIIGNSVIQDSSWLVALQANADSVLYNTPIFAGSFSYGSAAPKTSAGYVTIENNILKNCGVPGLRGWITVFTNPNGEPIDTITIKGNSFYNVYTDLVREPAYGVISVVPASGFSGYNNSSPLFVDISDNTINVAQDSIKYLYAIYSGKEIRLHDNKAYGNKFTQLLFSMRGHYKTFSQENNYWNDKKIIDAKF